MIRGLHSNLLALGLGALLVASGCGGGGGDIPPPPPPPPSVNITISPTTAQPFLGQTQQFTATVTGTTNTAVTWSVNGITGGSATVGSVSATGLYTAPQILPSPATVSVTATSQEEPTKSASAQVTIRSDVAITATPPTAIAELGATQQFTGTITGSGSPNTSITWSVNGGGGGSTTFGTISATGLYAAPRIFPSPATLTITATSVADSSKSASSTVTVTSTFSFAMTGPASVLNGDAAQYTATVTPAGNSNPDRGATWGVSGTGCSSATCGIIDSTGRYIAPTEPPSPATVRITGTSVADPRETAFLDVTIQQQIAVFVTPTGATLATSATQQFLATVAGTANQSVTWSLSGASCSGATCGTIDTSGLYVAPNLAPAPDNRVTVTATSNADPTKSASATVTIAPGPLITKLIPASIIAGPASGFTFKVQGSNFVAGSPGSGSTILFRGSSRNTTCASTIECTVYLEAADVPVPGNIPVQVRNPDGTLSNQALFMALAAATSDDAISLTSDSRNATDKDIIVVEPTTLGASLPQINIKMIGLFYGGICNARGSGTSITRPTPTIGTSDVEICLMGDGLGAIYTYTISGPSPNDITVGAVVDIGLGVRIRLTLFSTTLLGPRNIFVENANKEKSAAPGALEIRAP